MIVGTAGHIDHGKSALVTALTGQPMDRLAEERRRGITIDLNFAPLPLGPNLLAGVVDVPGHEDFVRTMVAGASGVDVALLVVAADEGLMPQTEEHLAIIEHLGVPIVLPVITKIDLVEPEWLDLVRGEIDRRLARSPLASEPPIAVSARTGEGIHQLRAWLAGCASRLAIRSSADLFRLPIDRAFSVAGVGTVVTGTTWSGQITVGASVRLLPDGAQGRVRSIEMHGARRDRCEPGTRTAVGIAGIDRGAVRRGMVLVSEDAPWLVSRTIDVEIGLQVSAPRALATRSRVRLHLGTAEVMARVFPCEPIEPGDRGLARLSLEEPVVARGEDRFVLRSYSPLTTIGGGRILDPHPPRRRSIWPGGLAHPDPHARFRALLQRRPDGVPVSALPVLLGVAPADGTAVARADPEVRIVGGLVISSQAIEALQAKAERTIAEFHQGQPSNPGMPLETLRRALRSPEVLVEVVLGDLGRAGRVRIADGVASLSGFRPSVQGGDAEIERVVRILEEAHLSPPSLEELARQTGRPDVHAILRLASASRRVEAVTRERYYARSALDQFVLVLLELGQGQPLAPAALRDRLGISRKFLIPLLEWADSQGITVRVGDKRRLRNA